MLWSFKMFSFFFNNFRALVGGANLEVTHGNNICEDQLVP